MFKPKINVFWAQKLVDGYTKAGVVDITPSDDTGPSMGFLHVSFSIWFIGAKLAWELRK